MDTLFLALLVILTPLWVVMFAVSCVLCAIGWLCDTIAYEFAIFLVQVMEYLDIRL